MGVLQYEAVNTPWLASLRPLSGQQGGGSSGPQPMEVDQVTTDKGKGKKGKKGDKGKGKGRGKQQREWQGVGWKDHGNAKGKDSGKNGKGWSNGNSQWKYQGGAGNGKGKGGSQKFPGQCHNCGKSGHWKNECPHPPRDKGKGKRVQQVEDGAASTTTSTTSTSTGATAYRTPSVQQVRASCLSTPPGCRETLIFDIAEEGDLEDFSLEEQAVLMIAATGFDDGVEVFAMDATDGDDDWVYSPWAERCHEKIQMVKAGLPGSKTFEAEVVVDSGADVSVAPLAYREYGKEAPWHNVQMQDAQGKHIKDHGARTLEITVDNTNGQATVLREKFALANVGNIILSLGRLLRSGWRLNHNGTQQVVEKDGCKLPIRLRRNTLILKAVIAAIATYDSGAMPPEAEDVISTPGWAIMPSGLPLLVAHGVTEVPVDGDVWDSSDWASVAVFVRKEEAKRLPRAGDVWLQVLTTSVEDFENWPKKLIEIDGQLSGKRDVAVLYHVADLGETLLTIPGDIFKEPPEEADVYMPGGPGEADDGGGIGEMVPEVWPEGRPAVEEEKEDAPVIDEVTLSVETPLRQLRKLCERLGLATSGGKAKVLRRLKDHHVVMERQMATELAKKVFADRDRSALPFRTPTMPSAFQQELHEITHQPFAPWCSACVMGRSRQSPHDKASEDKKCDANGKTGPVLQVDYCYTFTRSPNAKEELKEQGEIPSNEGENVKEKEDQVAECPDYRDQFGLNLVAAESTTGWLIAVPLVAKGSATIKRATEALVKMSMLLTGAEPITIQGDPEPAIKQLLFAVEACRLKLNLKTEVRLVLRASHASNGVAEKAVSTIRRHSLTLKAHLEERIKAEIGGHLPIYAWFLRHSSYLHNRFFVTEKGLPPFEIVHGRRFRAKMLPFGEQCIFFCCSKHKGDVQWRKGLWVGLNEKSGAHILLTPDGALESRSVRRLPKEQQWSAEAVVAAKGLPWDYKGTWKRKKPLYVQNRGPILPDSATLAEIAKAAGVAAAETVAALTPKPPEGDEAASDPTSPSSSSSSTTSSSGRGQPDAASGIAPASDAAGGIAPASDAAGGIAPASVAAGSSGRMVVDTSRGEARPLESAQGVAQGNQPKRPRLLLDRPAVSPTSRSPQVLYPPGFAGVNLVHGDIEMEELAGSASWAEEVGPVLESETHAYDDEGDGSEDRPPEVSPAELETLDMEADKKEVERLLAMGVMRPPRAGEDLDGYGFLTTKVVRDWRRRPHWLRRSRLVAREFRTWEPWQAELFAPSSNTAVIHALMSLALAEGLEITTIDVKDAYLNVKQRAPVIIEVDERLIGGTQRRMVPYVLEFLLPGQRAAASEWFDSMVGLLGQAGLEGFAKEPTLFRATGGDKTQMVLHADDGVLASTKKAREDLVASLSEAVVVQVSEPLSFDQGIEFLKRHYTLDEQGIMMNPSTKYLDNLLAALPDVRPRDTPADASFLEKDTSPGLEDCDARLFRECTGRLLYLSHSRCDLQFAVCILAAKMAQPTAQAMKNLKRVVGYLESANAWLQDPARQS